MYLKSPSDAVLDDDVAWVKVAKGWEASFLQKEQSFENLTTESLHLKKWQTFRSLPVLLTPVVLPAALFFCQITAINDFNLFYSHNYKMLNSFSSLLTAHPVNEILERSFGIEGKDGH